MIRRFECRCNCLATCLFCGKPGSAPHTTATLARHAGIKAETGLETLCRQPARWIPLADVEAGLASLRRAQQITLTAGNRARLTQMDAPAYGLRAIK